MNIIEASILKIGKKSQHNPICGSNSIMIEITKAGMRMKYLLIGAINSCSAVWYFFKKRKCSIMMYEYVP